MQSAFVAPVSSTKDNLKGNRLTQFNQSLPAKVYGQVPQKF